MIRFSGWLATISITTVALAAGCAPKAAQPPQTQAPITPSANAPSKQSVSAQDGAMAIDATPAAPRGSSAAKPSTPSSEAQTTGSDVVAMIDDVQVTRRELEAPLLEGYGLNMLAKVAQLKLAKQEVRKQGLPVGDEQVQAERQRYLSSLFNEEKDPVLRRLNTELEQAVKAKDETRAQQVRDDLRRERSVLLDQLLQQQKLSRADFDLFIEANTYLRAIAEAQLKKAPLTEEALRSAFGHLYGEKVQIRDIQLANLQEATEAKRRLASGEDFATVARDMSRDPQAAPLGGELPPFTRDTPGLPQQFKDVAFALKPDEVSDAVEAEGSYHIIQLKQRIAPNKLVKYEDVKDSVRQFLAERQLEGMVKELRATLQRQVLTTMKINEPILAEQFKRQTTHREDELRDKNDIRRELDRRIQEQKEASTRPAATQNSASSNSNSAPPSTAPHSAAPPTERPAPGTGPTAATRPK